MLQKKGYEVEQIGVKGEKQLTPNWWVDTPFAKLKEIVSDDNVKWVSVDNFFPHFIDSDCGGKPGVVLWGQSDPEIFGYSYNKNLIKDRLHLRPSQYDVWTNTPYFTECFVSPEKVVEAIESI
jgi:hypothetical protein